MRWTGRRAPLPDTGESWQYIGTVDLAGKRFYEFRHRHHPAFQRRLYVSVHALSAEHETAPQEKPWRTLQSVGGVYDELEGA